MTHATTDAEMDKVENAMNETADTFSDIAAKVMDCTTVMWMADPVEHPLGQLNWKNDFGLTPAEAKERLEGYLRDVAASAYAHTPGILTMWLRSTFSVRDHLQSWEPLYIRAREAITRDLGEAHCNRIMQGLEPKGDKATAHNSRK